MLKAKFNIGHLRRLFYFFSISSNFNDELNSLIMCLVDGCGQVLKCTSMPLNSAKMSLSESDVMTYSIHTLRTYDSLPIHPLKYLRKLLVFVG